MAANNRSGCKGKKVKVGTGDNGEIKGTARPLKNGWRDKIIKLEENKDGN